MLIPLSLSGYICSLGTVTPSIRLPVMKKKIKETLNRKAFFSLMVNIDPKSD